MAPGLTDSCDNSASDRMSGEPSSLALNRESYDSSAESNSEPDGRPVQSCHDWLRRRHRHYFEASARSRWAYSCLELGGQRAMAERSRGSTEPRLHWTAKSFANLPTKTGYHG